MKIFISALATIDVAIDAALASACTRVVLADVADNAGTGAAADNTNILRRLLERRIEKAAVGCFWDPVAGPFKETSARGSSAIKPEFI
jgi:microcystin degradation protein MlrC